MISKEQLETDTLSIGGEIIRKTALREPHFWEPFWWERRAIQWISSDPAIKTGALRFVEAYPALRSGASIVRHLLEYIPREALKLHLPSFPAPEGVVGEAVAAPAAAAVNMAMTRIAKVFIAGESPEEAARSLDKIIKDGMTYTLDILGEATLSEKEADVYAEKYVNLIRYTSAGKAMGDPAVSVSVKLSSLSPRFDPVCSEFASEEVRRRLRPIFRTAIETGSTVCVDMERYYLRDLTLSVFRDIMEEPEFSGWEGAGIVVQTYLKDAEQSLDELLAWVEKRGKRISVRLVKGAYWDSEIITANANGWPVPVFTDKAETDANFEKLAEKLLARAAIVDVAAASHNVRSIANAIALARDAEAGKGRFEVQMLYGMGGPVKKVLSEMNVPVRVYAPVGELLQGMAYLVRRILENSSNESFLKHFLVENATEDELMAKPNPAVKQDEVVEKHAGPRVFINEPEPMFHNTAVQSSLSAAVELVSRRLGKHYLMTIGGESVNSEEFFHSTDPSRPARVIGAISLSSPIHAEAAMEAAQSAFADWKRVSAEKRSEILLNAAQIVRERKHELAAWQILEVGKNWKEAVADVTETVDYFEFFAHAIMNHPQKTPAQKVMGEMNYVTTRPRGSGVVISPWNFPLAILAGMTISAIAAGNTVTIKPSSSSPVTAALFMDILRDAGLPAGVANMVFGPGDTVGSALIAHPATSFVCFTGSWEAGRAIAEQAAMSGERFIKVIAETGGKNAVIVDESTDMDEAVEGVVASAFGYGGQKCSACSRVIVLESVYDAFVKRLLDAVDGLDIGAPENPQTFLGPLIDDAARRKTEMYIETGRKEAKPLLIRKLRPSSGHFVGPAVFGGVSPDAVIAQEEIFGPVLSIIPCNGLDNAIKIANGVKYALTAGIYTRTPSSVEKFVERIEAGNVYINRKITGAIVGRQPFGGFKRSGYGGAKAGSAEILRELSVNVTVSENLLRHGFSPDVGN